MITAVSPGSLWSRSVYPGILDYLLVFPESGWRQERVRRLAERLHNIAKHVTRHSNDLFYVQIKAYIKKNLSFFFFIFYPFEITFKVLIVTN